MAQALKIVKQDIVYETIHSYITDSSKSVTNYEEMIEVVLDMIREGHCFLMDRDILRDCLETLTFMYEPNDDMNKDRVVLQLIDIDDDEDDGEEGGMDMLKNLGKMMGMPDMGDMMKEASAPEDETSAETEEETSGATEEETSAETDDETSAATEDETSAATEDDTSAETEDATSAVPEDATTNSEDQ